MEMNKREIGKRIARMRNACGLTQEQLCKLIGYSKNHLSGIERGTYTITAPMLFKLCTVLGNTPDYYLIGKISAEANEITRLIMRLSPNEQGMLEELLKVYVQSNNRE